MRTSRVRDALTSLRRRRPRGVLVVGGPCDGQRVRVVATLPDGAWIMDRAYLCQPSERRGQPHELYPYRYTSGRYVWSSEQEVN